MITKKEIVEMVHHVLRRDAGHTDRREIHPMREWAIGLGVVFVLFVGASGYAGYKLYVLMEGNMHVEFQESTGITYDQENIQQILETYSRKANTFNTLRAERSAPPPSAAELDDESIQEEEETEDTEPENILAE